MDFLHSNCMDSIALLDFDKDSGKFAILAIFLVFETMDTPRIVESHALKIIMVIHSFTGELAMSDWVLEPLDFLFEDGFSLESQLETTLDQFNNNYSNLLRQNNRHEHLLHSVVDATFDLEFSQENVESAPETVSVSAVNVDVPLMMNRDDKSLDILQEVSLPGIHVSTVPGITTDDQSRATQVTANSSLVCPVSGCPEVFTKFSRSSTLKRHIESKHNRSPRYICPHEHCKRAGKRSAFDRKDGLERHLLKCKFQVGRPRAKLTPSSSESRCSSETPGPLLRSRDANKVSRRGVLKQKAKVEDWKQEHKRRLEALEGKERECREERARLEELACRIRELDESDDEYLEEGSA